MQRSIVEQRDLTRYDLHPGELLLRLDQRSDELVAKAEQVGVDEGLVHSRADEGGRRQRFGEVRVVAQVLHRVDQRELEAGEIALEHLSRGELEDPGVD